MTRQGTFGVFRRRLHITQPELNPSYPIQSHGFQDGFPVHESPHRYELPAHRYESRSPPAEIRQQIFSDVLPDSYNDGESEGDMAVLRWTSGSIAPLLLNRQCYREALYALYSRREFYIYLADRAGITLQPQPRAHALVTAGPAAPQSLSEAAAALISRLSVHVFVPSMKAACVDAVREKIEGVVAAFAGRRLAILRVRFTFGELMWWHRPNRLGEAEVARTVWAVMAWCMLAAGRTRVEKYSTPSN